MSVRLCRWGNSTGLRVPVTVLEAAGLTPGRYVSLRVLDNGDIRLRPVGQVNPSEPTDVVTQETTADGEWGSDKW